MKVIVDPRDLSMAHGEKTVVKKTVVKKTVVNGKKGRGQRPSVTGRTPERTAAANSS